MKKIKKIALIGAVPLAALMLAGCGKKDNADKTPPAAPGASVSKNATPPANTAAQPQASAVDSATAAASKQQGSLSTLPADNKAAISTEITNIDKELKTADTAAGASEITDTQLGL